MISFLRDGRPSCGRPVSGDTLALVAAVAQRISLVFLVGTFCAAEPPRGSARSRTPRGGLFAHVNEVEVRPFQERVPSEADLRGHILV